MEKQVAQIFERTKRIIDQARQQCHLWEHHLSPKLILNGISPPPWLCNSALHSLPSDPEELNKGDLVSEVLFSQPQSRVPFSSRHCSLYSNLVVVTDDVQYPIGLHNEVHALKKDCNAGDGLSNLPDCSVNNDRCASTGATSPQNQIESRISDSCHDPALSLAKLQRSKSRQRALELRNSAKAPKRWSGDDNNAGVCAGTITGSASSSLQADHIEESDLVKDFHANIQSCSMEEARRGDCLTEKNDKSNYSGCITRSKSLSQKLTSLNVSSSVVKEDGPLSNNVNELLELRNQPCFTNGICGVKEANKGEYQRKETGSSVDHKRLTKSRSSSQARYNSELLELDSTSGRGKGVEVNNFMQPFAHIELTDSSKASDHINGGKRNTVKDGDFCNNKQESNFHGRIKLLRSSCPSPSDDFLMTGGSLKSINKSLQSPQPLISQHSKDPAVSVVGSFRSQKDPDFCAVKAKEHSSRSNSGEGYITRGSKPQNLIEGISKSCSSNFCEKSASSYKYAGKKSQNVRLTKLGARRLSSSQNESKLDTEIAMDSAEKENAAAVTASRNTRAVTACATVAEKVLGTQENIQSGANPIDIIEDRSAATVAKVDADFDILVEKDPSCLGSRLTGVNPKVGLDVSVLRMPSDFVMSVMPKQLDFDDIEESSMNGISSPDLKEGRQGMSPEEPVNLLEPVYLLDEETSLVCQGKCNSLGEMHLLERQEVLIREGGSQKEYCASHFEEAVRKAQNAMSPNKELPVVQTEFSILTSSLMNCSIPSQVAGENSSGSLSNEVMGSKSVSGNSKLENNDSNTKLADAFSAAVTVNGLHKYADITVPNLTVEFPSATSDVEHSCPQHKRRKIEIEAKKCLPASSNFLKKPLVSIDQKSVGRNLSIEKDNREAVLEVQNMTSHPDEDIGNLYFSNSPMDGMQDTGECHTMEGSSLKVRKEEKFILDGRDRSEDTLLMVEANPSGFSVDSTMRCTIDEKVDLLHHQVNCGQETAEHLTCVERSTLSRRIYPGGNAKFSDGSSISPGIQFLDSIGTDETLPEFEGFIMQPDNAQPCTVGDQMELENMNLPISSIDYTSLGKSRIMHSPLCYSSTPYRFPKIPDLFQSLPNRLLEGMDLRPSLPLNDGSARSLSDCLPNCKGQYTSSVQTLWDRINSNFGSSGKRESLKLELPCINEENEIVDEMADTFQKGIGLDGMTSSITREPLTEIVDNANPSASVLQDDISTDGRVDSVSTEFSFSGTHNKVKKKLDQQDGNRRRCTSKGKENQSIYLGANGAKRTTESVCNRSSRPKLSGKNSMKKPGPTYSQGKSTCNNIISNITSFIPLVQQKQAAAVFTGKRDIKVKALEAAEAAKRNAEKKENERKMKKEALRLERERLEQQNLRQLELQKKKKEEERKKKEAEMATKKRQREDEEKKEKERKRKRVNDTKKQQKEQEKICAKKEEIEIQSQATGEGVQESKKFMDERENHKNLQDNREGNVEKISDSEPLTIRDPTNDKTKESCLEYSEAVNDCGNNRKVMGILINATEDDDLIIKNSLQEQSYEISPYKGSDDEDEDEDDIPNNKFIPSWASKHCLSLVVSSQKMDPETIFPPQSFCNMAEVLLPRKLQL